MRWMRWTTALMSLCLALVAALTGCASRTAAPPAGGSSPSAPADAGKPASQPAKPTQTYVIKLGHANDPSPDSIFHVVAEDFKKRIEKASDGRIKVEIYPSGQLGDEQAMVKALQLNTAQATLISMANLNPFSPSTYAFSLPYLFESIQEGRRAIDKLYDQAVKWVLDEAGVRLLGIMDAGFRQLTNSKRPVRSLQDLQGLRIRIPPNKIMVAAFKSWGIEPVPMAWSETFQALQQKVVDGQENPINVLVAVRFYEVQKYVTDIDYMLQTSVILLSEKFYQSLPADLREVVVKAGRETMVFERELADKSLVSDQKKSEEKGMVFLGKPTDRPLWIEKARATWPQFYELIGNGNADKGKQIVEAIQKAK